jgi:hypothetical protein
MVEQYDDALKVAGIKRDRSKCTTRWIWICRKLGYFSYRILSPAEPNGSIPEMQPFNTIITSNS